LPHSRWLWLLAAQKRPKKLPPPKRPLKKLPTLAWKLLKLLATPLLKPPKLLAKPPKLLLKALSTLPKLAPTRLLLLLAKPRTLPRTPLPPLAKLPRSNASLLRKLG